MSKIKKENFYDRLKVLGGVAPAKSGILETATLVNYKRSNDGAALGIVKENHSYFIKTSNSKTDDLKASDFSYIGGLENKFKYQYNALSEAEKNRNFFIATVNEAFTRKYNKPSINEGEDIAKAQSNADATTKATITDKSSEKAIAEPVAKSTGAAKAQGVADTNKSDDASAKLKQDHEGSETSSGAARQDIAKAQANANPTTKGPAIKDTAAQKEIAKPEAKNAGAAKAQPVADANKSNDASAKLKTTAPKEVEPASDAKKEKAIVIENFGQEEETATEVPAPDAAPAPAVDAVASPDAAGDESGDLAAAADALADMGVSGDDAGADVSLPAPDASAAPAGDAMGSPDAGSDVSADADADGAIKDIEKLTGKVTQKIRSTVLTPELTSGFLKSYLTAFQDKINDLEHEDRKELANLILKDQEAESGLGDGAEAPAEVEDEKDIEEAINQHLAEMGIGSDSVEGETAASDPTKSFKSYVADKGYDPEKVEEISLMEMVSLVNGYTNECCDGEMDGEGMSDFVTSEVSDKVSESGNAVFEGLMKPFGDKIKKNKKAYACEAVVPSINEAFGEEESEEEGGEEEETAEIVDTPSPEKADVTFAPAGETIAIGTPSTEGPAATASPTTTGTKSVTVDLNNNTINMSLSEAEVKMHRIVKKKIEEALSGKKSPINESKKSALSIMIDELVNEAIERRREAIAKRLAQV